MTVVKCYCDVCGKNVSLHSELEDIILDTKAGAKCRYEVCSSCYSKIKTYIWRLKKDFKEDNYESVDCTE